MPNAIFNLTLLFHFGNLSYNLILFTIIFSTLFIKLFCSANAGNPYNNLDLWKYPNIYIIDLTLKYLLFSIKFLLKYSFNFLSILPICLVILSLSFIIPKYIYSDIT